jgi:RNA polymerase sigma-70 factor (ECF subfamily)
MRDPEIWQKLKDGDRNALEQIYRKHIDLLARYGMRFSSDTSIIEDAIHDMFVDLWRKRDGLGMTDSIQKYLFVAFRRRLIRMLKAQYSTMQVQDIGIIRDDSTDQEIKDQGKESLVKVKEAMKELTRRQQEAVHLKYTENYTYDEICEIMGIGYQSVRNLISSAIKSIRKNMAGILATILL